MKFYGGRNVQDGDETIYDKQFFGGFSDLLIFPSPPGRESSPRKSRGD
jgi:hypothetical protein